MNNKSKIFFWIGIPILIILSIVVLLPVNNVDEDSHMDGVTATLYKDPNCGCCGNYAAYLLRNGIDVETVNETNMSRIKLDYGVTSNIESCHTMALGDYFVEGHVPIEAIEKLLSEKPDIKGIALPGMPNGSPGMPGSQGFPFVVLQLGHNGESDVFMEV